MVSAVRGAPTQIIAGITEENVDLDGEESNLEVRGFSLLSPAFRSLRPLFSHSFLPPDLLSFTIYFVFPSFLQPPLSFSPSLPSPTHSLLFPPLISGPSHHPHRQPDLLRPEPGRPPPRVARPKTGKQAEPGCTLRRRGGRERGREREGRWRPPPAEHPHWSGVRKVLPGARRRLLGFP